MIALGTLTNYNVDVPDSLLTHNQEEADTLLIMHAQTVGTEVELIINVPDRDVLLLLVYMNSNCLAYTTFLTENGN